MKFILIYFSSGGTTKSTAQLLKKIIERNDHQAEIINIGISPYKENLDIVLEKLRHGDIAGFGSPAYHMDMAEPMLRLFHEMAVKCREDNFKFKAFFYLNYGGITSGKAFENASKIFRQMKIPITGAVKIAAPHFHHKEPFPTETVCRLVEEFYDEMQNKEFASIEWKRLEAMFKPEKKRVDIIFPFARIVGKTRNLPITIDLNRCIKCGNCIAECPVGAINEKDGVSIDFTQCIHCYHCLLSCKRNAVTAPVEKIDDMMRINKRILGTEKCENQIYV